MTSKAQNAIRVAERYSPVQEQVLAVQWDGTPEHGKILQTWSEGKVRNTFINARGVMTVEPGNNPALVVDTPYGQKIAKPTDYVIRNAGGSFFVDAAGVFEAGYVKDNS
jgi:hypothetical protein